jgi:hypothetical protein
MPQELAVDHEGHRLAIQANHVTFLPFDLPVLFRPHCSILPLLYPPVANLPYLILGILNLFPISPEIFMLLELRKDRRCNKTIHSHQRVVVEVR